MTPSPISTSSSTLALSSCSSTSGSTQARPAPREAVGIPRVGLIDLNVNPRLFVAALALIPLPDAVVVASAFYISSSVLAFASILENKKMVFRESETVVWMMVFEDIVLVLLIVILHSGFTIPVSMIARFAVVAAVLFLACRWGKRAIRRALDRDDELPVLITFTMVVAAAFVARAIDIPDTLTVIALGAALSTTAPAALERQARPFKDVFLVLFFVFRDIRRVLEGRSSPSPRSPACRLEQTPLRRAHRTADPRLNRGRYQIWSTPRPRVLHHPCSALRLGGGLKHHRRYRRRNINRRLIRRKVQPHLKAALGTATVPS